MADQYAGSDVARIVFDGADNATTATDALGHTLVFNGTAKLSTAQCRYGTASLLLDGTSTACVTSANSSDWNLGTGDFCIDYFVRSTNLTGSHFAIADGTNYVCYAIHATGVIQFFLNGQLVVSLSAGTWTDNQNGVWNHIAFTRSGSTVSCWIDGRLAGTGTATNSAVWNTSMVLSIGNRGGLSAAGFYGNIDQFRITKGAARYTRQFTLPISNFNTFDLSGVQTLSIGPRSKKVSVYGATEFDAIIAAVDQAIVDLGWEVYDTKYKMHVTKVYRKLNKDASTYKYTVFIWDKSLRRVRQTSCESWSTSTQTMTNETYSLRGSHGQHGVTFTNCEIYIFGSDRYLGMMTCIDGSFSPWSLCAESEREDPADTVGNGYPCWGMTFGNTFMGLNYFNTARFDHFTYPRAPNGATGAAAACHMTQVTSVGAFGQLGRAAKYGDVVQGGNSIPRKMKHAWNTSKTFVSHLKHTQQLWAYDASLSNWGRVYGVKAAPCQGKALARVSLPIDADMWVTSGGTDTEHLVLPTTVISNTVLAGKSSGNNLAGTVPDMSVFSIGVSSHAVTFTGQYFYIATDTAGVYKMDAKTGVVAAVSGTTGAVYDVCFDGKYVYAAMASGIYRINTTNSDSVETMTIGTGGIFALHWTGRQFLYASQRTTSLTPSVYKIDTYTWTSVATITFASRADTNNIVSFANDGDNKVGGVMPAPLAANSKVGWIDVQANTGTWDTALTGTPGGTVCGLNWNGDHFSYSYGTTGTLYGQDIAASGGGVLDTGWAAPCVGTTIAAAIGTTKRSGYERIHGYSFLWLDNTSNNPNVIIYGSYDSYTGTDALTTVASATTTISGEMQLIGTRAMMHTGNSIIIIDKNNLLRYQTNLYVHTYGGYEYASTLIPA